MESVQSDNLFKIIKLNVIEFARSSQGGPTERTFCIKCRYLKSDRQIKKKRTRIRKNSNLMITDEMIRIDKTLEYIVKLQDIHFLLMFIAMNIESPTEESASSYIPGQSDNLQEEFLHKQ
ncbi:1623_t:CDS:1 [Funneliformis caledonium]|uniref:1623_t:CDS:1 n=1 Tax=Funneliformis caledonium TaxID=1117310 RepID=A0A9N8V446_9GLOM|nr:1623_t:CDS:1 [Funneliformis caledonium]